MVVPWVRGVGVMLLFVLVAARVLVENSLYGRADALPFRKMSHFVRWSFALAKLGVVLRGVVVS